MNSVKRRQVACPVALHPDGAPLRLPMFEHPQAGFQLVKGRVKEGEHPDAAAARELFEESGLETRAALLLGTSDDIQPDVTWHFCLCRIVPPVRDAWVHLCSDDSGHLFRFFWQDLNTDPPTDCDPVFHAALAWIREHL
jgi:ADP-ribose pyrophosphatase YjhB (NUDIX family)